MKQDSIVVALRLSAKTDSKVKAFADATIPLGEDGAVTVLGFSVLEMEGRPPRVMAPARKGKQSWFDIVELTGKIRPMVETAILADYERQKNGKK